MNGKIEGGSLTGLTLKEKAYHELKRKILSGELTEGTNLTEQTMVSMLDMSRTPIRAALEKLESDGLVRYTPNRGITVVEISLKRAVDIFDYRSVLESHVVQTLAKRGLTAAQQDWLEFNLQDQMKSVESNDYYRFTSLDSSFHLYLVACNGNQEMNLTMERMQDHLFQLASRVLSKDNSRLGDSYKDHQLIVDLIMQSKPEECSQKMIEHLDYGKRILVL